MYKANEYESVIDIEDLNAEDKKRPIVALIVHGDPVERKRIAGILLDELNKEVVTCLT